MRLTTLTATMLLCSSLATAQNKIYYDETWNETKHRHAAYYRMYNKQNDNLYNVEDHYIDGQLYMTGQVTSIESPKSGYRNGYFVFYDKAGNKTREGMYKSGLRIGLWKTYYPQSEAIKTETMYPGNGSEQEDYYITYNKVTGKKETKHIRENNEKRIVWTYSGNDSTSKTETISKPPFPPRAEVSQAGGDKKHGGNNDSTKVYSFVEQMPKAPYSIPEYLAHNIRYPLSARRKNIAGRVIVKFVVDEDGLISRPEIVRSLNVDCDDEVLRVVSSMPAWEPGKQNGVPVRVFFTLPVEFTLK